MNRVKRRENRPSITAVKATPPPEPPGFPVYVGNLAKTATREQLRAFFGEDRPVQDFCFRLEDCRYCPTKVALIRFANREDQQWAFRLNQTSFQGNRLLVTNVDSKAAFTPQNALMVKNLDERINEEDLYQRFRPIGAIECVVKPTLNYGYVSFVHSETLEGAMKLQNQCIKGVEMNIQPVRRNISMLLEMPAEFGSIREKCGALGLKYRPEAESETRLLITNIPRQTAESDVLEYFGKFGKISDWIMEKSAISVMTNSAGVTYLDSKTARAAFLAGPHYFQGGCLDVYNPQLQFGEVSSKLAVILQRTSTFITNDEIFQAMNECGPVSYIHRVDPVRHCTIVRFRSTDAVIQALKINQIGGENVLITNCTERNYNTEIPPYPEMYPKTAIRLQKEETLDYLMEKEEQAARKRLPTVPDEMYRSPSEEYFRNEVRILNYPVGTTLTQYREYFRKHGNVINLRENRQGSRCAEAFVSFDTMLEARRACQMNQCFMGARRLVVHLAAERVHIDPAMCVRVTGLKKTISDEEIYDSFCELTVWVRFVLRESDEAAVVGFDQSRLVAAAMNVVTVAKAKVQTSRIERREDGQGMSREPDQIDSSTEEDDRHGNLYGDQYDDQCDEQYDNEFEDSQVNKVLEPIGGLSQRGYYEQDTMSSNDSTHDVPELGDVRRSWQVMGLRKHTTEPSDQHNSNDSINYPEGQRMRDVLEPRNKLEDAGYDEALRSRMPKERKVMEPTYFEEEPEYDESGELLGTRRRKVPVVPPISQESNDVYGDIGGMAPLAGQWDPLSQQEQRPAWNAGSSSGPMPSGPGPMGPVGLPSNPDQITPLMRNLMQKIEAEMSYTQAFSTMPMIEQFRLVNGIINQHLLFPPFTNMAMDDKIGYLSSGANGFPACYAFGLFTYPQQQQLLSLIHADFVKNNPHPLTPGPIAPNPGPNITPAMRSLMQKIEAEMSSTQAFCTMPMIEQLRLVDGIIKQHRTFKKFTGMSVDDKIKHLISGANGFDCTYSFTLFTYPQQHMLLSLIHADYIKHHPEALKPELPRTVTTIAPVETTPSPAITKPDPTEPTHFTAQRFSSSVPLKIPKRPSGFEMCAETKSLIKKIENQLPNSAFPTLSTVDKVRLLTDLEYFQKSPHFVKRSLHGKIKYLIAQKSLQVFRCLEIFKLFTYKQQETLLSIIHAEFLQNNVVKPYLTQNPAIQQDDTDYSLLQKSRSPSPMTLPDHLNRAPTTRSSSPLDLFPTTGSRTSRSRTPSRHRSQPRSATGSTGRDLSPVSDEEFETVEDQQKKQSPSVDSERFSISPEPVMGNRHSKVKSADAERTVFVSNIPMSTSNDELAQGFGRFGQIVAQELLSQDVKYKRAYIRYSTVEQAQRAVAGMHLECFRNGLLTVRLCSLITRPRSGFSVKVFSQSAFSEMAVYDTFKMCGAIVDLWVRSKRRKMYCVVDFKHRDAVRAAMEVRKLNIGWPCDVTPFKGPKNVSWLNE